MSKISDLADKLPYSLVETIADRKNEQSIREEVSAFLKKNHDSETLQFMVKEWKALDSELLFSLRDECSKKTHHVKSTIEKCKKIQLLAAIAYLSPGPPMGELLSTDTTSYKSITAHLLKSMATHPTSIVSTAINLKIINLNQTHAIIALENSDDLKHNYAQFSGRLDKLEYLQILLTLNAYSKHKPSHIKNFENEYTKAEKEHKKVKTLIEKHNASDDIARLLQDHDIPLTQNTAAAICLNPNASIIIHDLEKIDSKTRKRASRKTQSKNHIQRTVEIPCEAISFISKFKKKSEAEIIVLLYTAFINTQPHQRRRMFPNSTIKTSDSTTKQNILFRQKNLRIEKILNSKLEAARTELSLTLKELSFKLINEEYQNLQHYLKAIQNSQYITQKTDYLEPIEENQTQEPNPNRFK